MQMGIATELKDSMTPGLKPSMAVINNVLT